jgi:hypothetical protein
MKNQSLFYRCLRFTIQLIFLLQTEGMDQAIPEGLSQISFWNWVSPTPLSATPEGGYRLVL